uniref:Protein YOP1 n=1 Tax=Amphora coffeiformis TaxID=265554 RepID=A0A7S3LAL0_9STRA|mmetsp:Transcript_12422/g.23717  ORF Transcript_12422/g.23717 Transcript_12422/m.23717 type:complete len:169 (+) Transcript_12422:52-558(+)
MTMELPPQIKPYVDKVDGFMAKYPSVTQYELFKKVETETGLPKVFFFIPACILLTVITTLVGGLKLVVDLLGFLYPAYMSFKSMDSGSKDDTQWLTYWVVFSFFSIFESLFGFLVALIPFYYFIKIGMIVWMYYPSTMGAKVIYEQALRPLLLPYLGDGTTGATKKAE